MTEAVALVREANEVAMTEPLRGHRVARASRIGIATHKGIKQRGIHEPLIEETTFERPADPLLAPPKR